MKIPKLYNFCRNNLFWAKTTGCGYETRILTTVDLRSGVNGMIAQRLVNVLPISAKLSLPPTESYRPTQFCNWVAKCSFLENATTRPIFGLLCLRSWTLLPLSKRHRWYNRVSDPARVQHLVNSGSFHQLQFLRSRKQPIYCLCVSIRFPYKVYPAVYSEPNHTGSIPTNFRFLYLTYSLIMPSADLPAQLLNL